MELILKIESNLASESIAQENKQRASKRRSAGNSPSCRSKSQIADQIRLDTTVGAELEYINILPDMSRINGVDESSFLKGIGTPKNVKGVSSLLDVEQSERIQELETQLEQHRKHIEDLEEERRSAGMTTDRLSSDNASSKQGETERS